MSDTDSFIDEVTEEVRRDRLFAMFRRYGWIAVVFIVLLVGSAAYNEYRKAQVTVAAETLGDDMIAALGENDAAGRAGALTGIQAETDGGAAILQMMQSAAQANSDQLNTAVAGLGEVSRNGDLEEIYRQVATFKALTLQAETLPAAELRLQFESLAQPGAPLRLLAEEQLALIDIREGDTEAALVRLQALLQDADIDRTLQQRATQLIVALGGTPEPLPGTRQG